jgi:erythromycin esterase
MTRSIAVLGLATTIACAARPAPSPRGVIAPAAPSAPVAEPSCAPLDEDLAPLDRVVGDARVVALGEATHADGAGFATKDRIVRHLHATKGFDVLAFESSLWACESHAVDCLAWPWAGVKEVDAVLAWARAEGVTITGFDPQLTGGPARLEALERWLLQMLAPEAALEGRLRTAFARYPKMGKFRLLSVEERTLDEAAFREARALAVAKRDALLLRSLDDVLVVYAWHAAVGADRSTTIDWDGHAETNDVRDRGMADDVRWLLDVRHPGKKIVLWLASSHAQKAPASVAYPGYAAFHSTGSWLAAWLGPRYVAVAIGAQGGRIGNAPTPEQDVTVPADAVERACASEVGLLRLTSAPAVGGFFGYQPMTAPWVKAFDAAVVVKTMTPATRIER